jgi:AmmeMemoRadiSam system protein A
MSLELNEDDRRNLLRLARASLRQKLTEDGSLDRELERTRPTPALSERRGSFVTLKQRASGGGETLRGCIGSLTAREPLYRSVVDLARKAAFEDPRFSPLTVEELPGVRIEISALTPFAPISDHEEIVIGRHGVDLRKRDAGAVFLPQVAVEHAWDRETLLRQLALKAGLGEDDWRDAELRVFEAQVFGEP